MAKILCLVVLICCAMQGSQAAFGLPSFIPIPSILGGRLPSVVTGALESARARVNAVGAAVQGQVEELVNTMQVAAGSVQGQAERAIQSATKGAMDMTMKAVEDATKMATETKKFTDDMITKATENMPKTEQTKKAVEDMTKKANQDMTKAIDSAKQCADKQIGKVETAQTGAVKGITSCVKAGMTVAKDAASDIMGTVQRDVEGVQKGMQALTDCSSTGNFISQGMCSTRAMTDLGMKSVSAMSDVTGLMKKISSTVTAARSALLSCVGGLAVGSVNDITKIGKEALKTC